FRKPTMISRLYLVAAVAVVIGGDASMLSLGSTGQAPVEYDRDIRPIFAKHCYHCHATKKPRSGLRLDARASLLQGGASGEPAILPGKSAASHLIKLVSGQVPDKVMPPRGQRLSPQEIQQLRTWIDQGAKWSGAETATETPLDTKHWSL